MMTNNSDRPDGDGLSERDLACLLANAVFAENLDEMPAQREEHSPSFCQADMIDAAREIQQAGFVVIKRGAPTRDGAEGAEEIPEHALWTLISTLHSNVPEDNRPMSWSDFSDEQTARLKQSAAAFLKALNAAPPEPVLKDPTQQSGLHQGEPRCLYPGCECSDLRACYPAVTKPAPDAVRSALEPFAKAADAFDSWPDRIKQRDDANICTFVYRNGTIADGATINYGHCRAARAALAAPVPSPDAVTISRCMEILEDVPGANLIDRVHRIVDWHHQLTQEYHDRKASPSPAVAAEPERRELTQQEGSLIHQSLLASGETIAELSPVRGDRDHEAIVMLLNKIAKEKSSIYLSPVCTSAMADAVLSFFVQPATRPDRESLAQAYALHRWKENLDNLPEDMKDDCYNFAGVCVGVQPGAGERDPSLGLPKSQFAKYKTTAELDAENSRQAPHSSSEGGHG